MELSPIERMLRLQIMDRGLTDGRMVEAMRSVPRDLFFPEGDREDAYGDHAASIGFGQTISQPYMVALMTQSLAVRPRDAVLEIGTGSGYQTAILARLARHVYTVERIKPLLDQAFERLLGMGIRNVSYRMGDGSLGWAEHAPFDRILIAAGTPALPRRLLASQLVDGGIAVLPIGPMQEQTLVEVRREGPRLLTSDLCACRFVKLIGEEGWSS